MSEDEHSSAESMLDPADDAPELTKAMFDTAEIAINGKAIRPATGYLGPNGVVHGKPPLGGRSKRQVTLPLDADVIEWFRADGPGWQEQMNAALRKAAGL